LPIPLKILDMVGPGFSSVHFLFLSLLFAIKLDLSSEKEMEKKEMTMMASTKLEKI